MKAIVQRVQRGRVTVDGQAVGEIGRGYVVFLGVRREDTEAEARFLAEKTAALRIFPDEQDRMNRSLIEVGGSVLAVSQFTLHAETLKGNRPSFIRAAPAEQARALFEDYVDALRRILGPERVATGRFQARMLVDLVNDGPVTIALQSRNEVGAPAGG